MLADASSPRGFDADLSIAGTLSERFRQVVAFPLVAPSVLIMGDEVGRDLFCRTIISTASKSQLLYQPRSASMLSTQPSTSRCVSRSINRRVRDVVE